MAYTRRGNVRLQHRDSKSLLRRSGSGSGSGAGKTRMAKVTELKSQRKPTSASSVRGPGIIETHTDDLDED